MFLSPGLQMRNVQSLQQEEIPHLRQTPAPLPTPCSGARAPSFPWSSAEGVKRGFLEEAIHMGLMGRKSKALQRGWGGLGIGAMGWIKVGVSGGSHRARRTQDIRVYFHGLICMSVSVPEVCVGV